MQTAQMKEIQQEIEALRSNSKITNEPTLVINQQREVRAKKNGFPKDLYHETLDAVVVDNREQEQAMFVRGYREQYIRKDYPRFYFRRNMAERFAAADFIEERQVATPQHFEELKKVRVKPGESPWFANVAELPELPDTLNEPSAITIARQQGELEALREAKKK